MNVSRTSRSSVRAEVEQAILDYSEAFEGYIREVAA